MTRYLLKEYGSWAVLALSFLAGITASGRFSPAVIPAFAALALFINSKQALALLIRAPRTSRARPAAVFAAETAVGCFILFYILRGSIPEFLPYAAVPLLYLILLRLAGEHFLLTELTGFALLCLAALISRYLSSGKIDPAFYLSTAVFFSSGVFKVRARLRKNFIYRVSLVLYAALAAAIYRLIGVPEIVLLPLADNVFYAAAQYKMSLKSAGRIELAKGVAFLVLLTLFYGK